MFQPFLYVPVTTTPLPFDIFAKYHLGVGAQHLPFRLYPVNPQLDAPAQKRTRSGPRGHYRRYSRQEKEEIILRVKFSTI